MHRVDILEDEAVEYYKYNYLMKQYLLLYSNAIQLEDNSDAVEYYGKQYLSNYAAMMGLFKCLISKYNIPSSTQLGSLHVDLCRKILLY